MRKRLKKKLRKKRMAKHRQFTDMYNLFIEDLIGNKNIPESSSLGMIRSMLMLSNVFMF